MNFDLAFAQIIDIEKGFVNHPADRGGPTKYGITIKTLSSWRKKTCTIDDVKNLTLNEAKQIYKDWYWDAVKGDSIRSYVVAFSLFDRAVNSGAPISIKLAQKVIGVTQDGKIGPQTINALNSFPENTFIEKWAAETRAFYGRLIASDPTQEVFKNGWENRVKELEKYLGTFSGKVVAGSSVFIIVGFLFFLILNSKSKSGGKRA